MSSTAAKVAKRCQELSKLSPKELGAFFKSFDTVMTDCDGVLWVGNKEIEGSAKCVRKLRDDLGKKLFYCTNNSTKSRQDYVEKCQTLGFGGTLEEMIGTSYLAAAYLKEIGFKGKVYVVGSSGISKELDLAGIPHVGMGQNPTTMYVRDPSPDTIQPSFNLDMAEEVLSTLDPEINGVVCGMDMHISYRKLMKAATVLKDPAAVFVGTNTDEQFPHKGGAILPGTGAIVAAVATAAGRDPVIMGKPSPKMYEALKREHPEVDPARTLMIGDRANTDILLGKNCGLMTLMVGSGCHSLANIREWEASEDAETRRLVADFYVDKLGDLVQLLEKAEM